MKNIFYLILTVGSLNLYALDCRVDKRKIKVEPATDQVYLECPMFISLPSYNGEYIKVLSLSTVTPKSEQRCHYKYKQESIDIVIACK